MRGRGIRKPRNLRTGSRADTHGRSRHDHRTLTRTAFLPLGEANGFPSAAEHLRYVQREMADHHQPVWRLHDRARVGDNSMLADPDDGTPRPASRTSRSDREAMGTSRGQWTERTTPSSTCRPT